MKTVAEIRAQKTEYMRRWRAANLDRARKIARESAARWRARNPETATQRNTECWAKWKAANPEKAATAERNSRVGAYQRHKERLKTWRANNKGRMRDYGLKARHGISQADYEALCEQQQHRCAICSEPLAGARSQVDHDHATLVIRGVLCDLCNKGLGQFKDDEQRLRAAADYLARHRS